MAEWDWIIKQQLIEERWLHLMSETTEDASEHGAEIKSPSSPLVMKIMENLQVTHAS